jgi:hypothetical protein
MNHAHDFATWLRAHFADFLFGIVLFAFTIFQSTEQYLFGGSPYPSGYDAISYLLWMTRAQTYGIASVIFPISNLISSHGGYILSAVLIHEATGLSYVTITDFLPAFLIFLFALLNTLFAFLYTRSRGPSYVAGFVTPIYYGSIIMTLDLQAQLFASLTAALACFLIVYRLRADLASESSIGAKNKWSTMFSKLLISPISIIVLLLLYYSAIIEAQTFAVWTAILVGFVVILLAKFARFENKSIVTSRIVWITVLIALCVGPLIVIGRSYVTNFGSYYFQIFTSNSLGNVLQVNPSNVLDSLALGVTWITPTFIWYENVGLSILAFVGLALVILEFVRTRELSRAYLSSIILSWASIALVLSIIAYFGIGIASTRGIALFPAPILVAVSTNLLVKDIGK